MEPDGEKLTYHQIYYRTHKERMQQQKRDWAVKNREYIREYSREYYRNNKSKMRGYRRVEDVKNGYEGDNDVIQDCEEKIISHDDNI